jgi:DNA-binding MarR family transcriptional regulator
VRPGDALEEARLVERSPEPRRATLVAPTSRGEEVAAGIRAARPAEAEGFFARLDEADRTSLARILRPLPN